MNPRNFQCSLVSRRKLRSLKMSPSKIRRLNLIDCKRCKASFARLTSEPRCTSEMIRVSIRSFPMHYFCSNSRLRKDESNIKTGLNKHVAGRLMSKEDQLYGDLCNLGAAFSVSTLQTHWKYIFCQSG